MNAYNSPNRKKTVIYVIVGVLILCMIGLLFYIVNLEDEEDPDAPAPVPSSGSTTTGSTTTGSTTTGSTTTGSSTTGSTTTGSTTTGSTTTGSSTTGSSSDGSISDFTPDSSICGDSDKEYESASECEYITNGKKCGGEDGKGGRWVNSKSKEKAVLCKWKNNECVYHKDCGSNSGGNTGGGGVNRCKDIKQYKNAKECKDINNDSEAEEKCKEGRWVNSESRENKAVLCKWENGNCVTGSDCESDTDSVYTPDESPGGGSGDYDQADINFCQSMIDRDGVIPTGVYGEEATGIGMNETERSAYSTKKCNEMHENGVITYTPVDTPDEPPGDGDIDYCIMITNIRPLIDEVNIEKDTLKNYERKLKSTSSRRDGGGWEKYRDRKSVRDVLRGELVNINRVLDLTYTDNDACESTIIPTIITHIKNFNTFFNEEIEKTNEINEDDEKYEYKNRNISFDTINWPFPDVETKEDLLEALEGFKNYEPYHNGNPRSSRKVPKPYDEHFVNFRSY